QLRLRWVRSAHNEAVVALTVRRVMGFKLEEVSSALPVQGFQVAGWPIGGEPGGVKKDTFCCFRERIPALFSAFSAAWA
ncbi:hypothetical protein, partial [Pontibacter sp. FD36]|uniref:hypothetical protein n=1 Tax=Pontibacter sp. FD36 TaxID=2789860 RepID=UPI001E3BCD69